MKLLPHLLNRFVQNGRLTVIDHDGMRQSFGSGRDGPEVTIRFTDAKVEREIFLNPELKAAEAYMDGRLLFGNGGTVYDLLYLFSVNRLGLGSHPVQRALRRAWKALRNVHQANPLGQAAANVRSHYDHPAASYACGSTNAWRMPAPTFNRRINLWKMRRWRSSAISRRSSPSRPA
jgi:cyclopropane-fatty-acyl-phospholipid synthase